MFNKPICKQILPEAIPERLPIDSKNVIFYYFYLIKKMLNFEKGI
jgi:hypothetical protein